MAWIQTTRSKDGRTTYWIRDVRDGRSVVIDSRSESMPEAEMKLEQYKIRRDLEKEGYDDQHQALLDRHGALLDKLWGSQQEAAKKSGEN